MWRVGAFAVLLAARLASGMPDPLSDLEYNQLPKLFTLDHYGECLVPEDAAFCLATFKLTSPAPSPLYDTIKEISRHERFNYDHTLLHRGVCVTKSCRRFLNSTSRDLDTLVPAMESCVNDSIHQEYGLEARVSDVKYCKRTGHSIPLGYSEYAVALVVVALLALNLLGSLYDVYIRAPKESGNPWLMAFSLRINWNQLTFIRDDNEGDTRLNNLKPIQGIRVLTMFLVIMSHVIVIAMYRVPPDNPRFIELVPYTIFSTILFNGHFVMQTYMVLASFLVAYNFLIYRETKKRFSWSYLSEAIVQRFFRLTPAYMLIISLTATWGARYTDGPLCFTLEQERATCRDKWWLHLFYVHNIFKASDICLPQSWYLGADFQLFVVGMTILTLLWRYPALTRPLLAIGFIAATALQFWLVYYLQLRPAILMQSPERVRNLFRDEPSFWLLHTSFQGNIQGYLLGLIFGISYYKWEKEGYRIAEKKWFRVLHGLSFPVAFGLLFAGYPILITDGENRFHLALYAMIDRFTFAMCMIFLLLGLFYKIDTLYLRIMGWRGWQAMGRLGYSAMLLHTITFVNVSCAIQYPRQIGLYTTMNDWYGNLAITYLLAVPLTLMVEFPLQRIQKVLTSSFRDKTKRNMDNGQQATNGKKIK